MQNSATINSTVTEGGTINSTVVVGSTISSTLTGGGIGPRGDTGPTGDTGPQGEQGDPGAAATIAVGTTTTLPAGSPATVANSGTSSNATFNFGIPQGANGAAGATGATGATGSQGPPGPSVLTDANGVAWKITVDTDGSLITTAISPSDVYGSEYGVAVYA